MFETRSLVRTFRNLHSDVNREISGCGEYEFIRLSSFVSKLFEAKNGIEPRVDFKVFDDYTEFSASAEYDFASLAVSPRYSPAEADVLVNVIKEYFDLI